MTTTALTSVRYGNLSRHARDVIKYWFGGPVTIAGYIRYWYEDGVWRGDSCGCPDDRCIGFHHEDASDCHCLENTLGEYATWTQGCPVCGQMVDRYDGELRSDAVRLVLLRVHSDCAAAYDRGRREDRS